MLPHSESCQMVVMHSRVITKPLRHLLMLPSRKVLVDLHIKAVLEDSSALLQRDSAQRMLQASCRHRQQ